MNLAPVFVSGALALSLLWQPAVATAANRSVVVKTADLDLGTMQDRNTLDLRIRAAAKNACAPTPLYLEERDDYNRCLAAATGSGRSQVVKMAEAKTHKSSTFASR